MLAAQRVTEEVLGTCRQEALLALRRSVLPCTPIRSKRKLELIADIAPECDTPANRQRIFAEVLGTWLMDDLRLFIARLKGLGYMVPVRCAHRPRQQDLIAAIVNAGECTAKAPIVSKQASKTRKDICSSASAAAATAPTVSKRARKECDARAPAEQSGLRAEGTSQGSSSTRVMGASEDPGSAVKPPSCTALVAVDSAAAPLTPQQRLHRRWRKKWVKFHKRQDRKQKLKRVEDELRKVFQEHQATATVGELRAMVGHAVGVPLDGKYRLRFDRALVNLTSAPLKKHRPKRRFTIARGSRTESA